MTGEETRLSRERERIVQSQARGKLSTFLTYDKLSGPAWMQSDHLARRYS